jgi:hypothetical protein
MTIVKALAGVLGILAGVFALRYFLWPLFGPTVPLRFKEGKPMADIIPYKKGLVRLSNREVAVAQRKYDALVHGSQVPENAMFTYFRELATRLNLRNRLKTLREMQEFHEQLTKTALAKREAALTLYRTYGFIPDDVPEATRERILREVGREDAAADFSEEEALHERARKRRDWDAENRQQAGRDRLGDLEIRAQTEEALTRIARAKTERKSGAPRPKNTKRASPEERVIELNEERERQLSSARRSIKDPEQLRRAEARINEKYDELINEVFS